MPLEQTGSAAVEGNEVSFDVPFNRKKFEQMIKGSHGYNVCWEKAQYCPFIKGPSPRDHDINCKVCMNGFIYFDPKPTQMLVMSATISQQYFAYGRFDTGKVNITAYPEFRVSFWDRITLCDSRVRFTELVVRQRSSLLDKLKFIPLCVERLVWADVFTDATLKVATQGTDFTIATGGEIQWLTTNRPSADTVYSIVYHYRPQYVVLDLPHMLRDQKTPTKQSEFPISAVAQLAGFIREEGRDESNESDVANPFPAQA